MHIRCPHCKHPIEVVGDETLRDVACPCCGSNFSLVGNDDPTVPSEIGGVRRIAHFELLERVGVGQFGAVWKARDTALDRIVALKIPRRGGLSPVERDFFFRDARAAAQLKHPNIVSVHEVGRDGEVIFIASDFIAGADLQAHLKLRRPSLKQAAELMIGIAHAVQHAHERGIIHRDLKPGNVLIDAAGQPHVADFGLAKRESGEITMTVDGQVLGTPAYMSPEQACGKSHEADARSDVYSLGVMLYEMLTSKAPFVGEQRMLLVQILGSEPESPRRVDRKIPRDLETIALKCLQKDPAQRYASAAAMAEDLRRWLDGEPIIARPVGVVQRSWRWCRRNLMVASLATCLAFSIIALSAVVARQYVLQPTARADAALDNQPESPNGSDTPKSRSAPGERTSHERASQLGENILAEMQFAPRRAFAPPTVRLIEQPRARAVVFILDCSASMVKSIGGHGSRINIARRAIIRTVESLLAGGDDVSVGLFLIGHRTRYEQEVSPQQSPASDAKLSMSGYVQDFGGDGVAPPADVEEAVPLVKLTAESRRAIERRLEAVQPHGYAPTYWAMRRALRDGFAKWKPDAEASRHLIVVTDGGNTQCVSDRRVTADVVTTADQLAADLQANMRAKPDSRIQVAVAGIDFDETRAQHTPAWNLGDLNELKKALEGAASLDLIASNSDDPARQLESVLKQAADIYQFSIMDVERKAPAKVTLQGRITDSALSLHQTIGLADRRGRFELKVESPYAKFTSAIPAFPFELTGREENLTFILKRQATANSIDRWIEQADSRRDALPFRVGEVMDEHAISDAKGNAFFAYPMRPILAPAVNGITFRVGISNRDARRFTPLPVEALAEVYPVSPTGRPIRVFDIDIRADQQTPTLSFTIPNWRLLAGGAKQAEILVWLKMDRPTTPVRADNVGSSLLFDLLSVKNAQIDFNTSFGVQAENAIAFVQVEQSLRSNDASQPLVAGWMDDYRITLDQAPGRVVRQLMRNGKVLHRFEFSGMPSKDLRNLKVLFTDVRAIKESSINLGDQPSKAFLVDVPWP